MSKKNNLLVANFMGLEHYKDGRYGTIWFNPISDKHETHFSLKYDESWNWLIPVVRKIGNVFIAMNWEDEAPDEYDEIYFHLINTNIEGVYNTCVGFIKWYNEQIKLMEDEKT